MRSPPCVIALRSFLQSASCVRESMYIRVLRALPTRRWISLSADLKYGRRVDCATTSASASAAKGAPRGDTVMGKNAEKQNLIVS